MIQQSQHLPEDATAVTTATKATNGNTWFLEIMQTRPVHVMSPKYQDWVMVKMLFMCMPQP